MKYNDLCEMDIASLLNTIVNTKNTSNSYSIEAPIQPDDDIGNFGNTTDIVVKQTEEGGLEIDSKEMAIKISKTVFEAIKAFIEKGDV